MPDDGGSGASPVRVGGYAGQALAADAVTSPDAPALAGTLDVDGATTTDTRFTGDDLDTLTKDQLYALAQGEDIKGRSDMNRDELIDALRG